MKSLLIRTGTGILFITLVIASILVTGKLGQIINLFNVFLLFSCLAIYEYRSLIRQQGNNLSVFFFIVALAIYFLLSYIPLWNAVSLPIIMLIIVALFFLFFMMELFRKQENPFQNIAYSLLGIIWIIIPFSLINQFPYMLNEGKYALLALFIFVWLYDTLAYCVGTLFGKHRLMERVSPKKSWEGTIGSAVLTIGLAFFAPKLFTMLPFSALEWMGFAAIVVVIGTLGDLVESLFKRQIGVKDSGNILPGHGGILDRFDSVLLIVPFILLYLHFIL
jgi:phosphatidate cytidylyltransferase